MAFNPEIPDSGIPNFTGVSRGTGTDESFSSLFAGLGDTFTNVTKIKDQQTQDAIRKDADALFNETNEAFNLTPEQADSPVATKSIFDLSVGESAPVELQGQLDRISTLKSALEQGKISEVNYYGRLATLSKQLRAKYPRYEEIVDQTIQQVTGTRPANAYRDALFAEQNAAAQEASSEAKFRRQYEKENSAQLSILYGDDYFTNPGSYDFNKVQAQVSRLDARRYQVQSATQDLALQKSMHDVNEVEATKTASQDFSLTVETALNGVTGANQPGFNERYTQFIQGNQSPEELNKFAGDITLLETQLRTTLLSKANSLYAGTMPQEKINQIIEQALYPVTQAKAAILGKDFALAGRYATVAKSFQEQNIYQLMQRSPEFVVGMGLKEVSNNAADLYLNEPGTSGNARYDDIGTIGLEIAGQIMAGNKGLLNDTIKTGNSRAARSAIDTTVRAITDTEISGPQLTNVVNDLFGAGAPVWDKEVRPEDYEGLYLKLLNPNVTKAIAERGSAEDLKTYADWAQKAFLSIPAFRSVAGEINHTMMSEMELQYDPGKKRIKILDPQNLQGPYSVVAPLTNAVNSLNRAFAVLDPITDALGEDGEQIIPSLIQQLNVSGVKGSFFDKALDAIQGAGGENAAPGSAGNDALAPLPDTGDLDFTAEPQGGDQAFAVEGPRGNSSYRDAIAKIESGGRYDIVGPRHKKMGRALGKYQVMEANLPAWSRAALGREVTAEEFLASPGIQDTIFDYIFGNYVRRFGERGAAQAWFGGPGGVGKNARKDSLGTSIGKYGDMFVSGLRS